MRSMHCSDCLLYLFCSFPFLYILPIPSDVQPYACCMALLYILTHRAIKIPRFVKKNVLTITVFLVAIILSIPFVDSYFLLFRKAFNYLSFFVITIAVYNSLYYTDGLNEKWIKIVILIWFFVGLVQTVISRDFMRPFVANMRTSATRGVNGMASEPSFYGYMMVFFAILCCRFQTNRMFYLVICIFQIVVLAQSAVAIVYLAIFAIAYMMESLCKVWKTKPRKVISALLAFTIGGSILLIFIYYFMPRFKNTRMVSLLGKLMSSFGSIRSIDDIYRIDESVGQRVNSIFYSLSSAFGHYGIPYGFIEGDGRRIMSGFGVVIYELGIFGGYLICCIVSEIYQGFNRSFTVFLGITAMMFSAVQFGSPIFAFFFGYAVYSAEKYRRTNLKL